MTTRLRQGIEDGFRKLGHLIYRHHWKTIILTLAVVAGLVSQLPKLTVDTSTEGFLHESDPTLLAYNEFRKQYGRDELVLVTIAAPDVFAADFLTKLKGLHDELRSETPYLDDITSLINARNTLGAEGELIVEDLLEEWPETAEQREAIRERAMANPVYRNMLLNEQGTITSIVIRTDAYVGDTSDEDVLAGFADLDVSPDAAEQELTPLSDAQNSEVVHKVKSIVEQYDGEDFKIYVAGSPVVSDVLKRSMMENMRKFLGMALLAIGVVLFLLFRRASGVVLPLLTVVLSLLSTFGLMSILQIPVKLPTQILPSFLLAVGVGASVHVLAVFYRKLQLLHRDEGSSSEPSELKEQAIVYALGHSGLAIAMTSLTTAAGLASFSGAEVAPIADLGLVAAMGVLISLLYTLVLIPALLSVIRLKVQTEGKAHARHERMDALLTRTADFATGRAKLVLGISALLLVLGIVGATQVKFSHKPFEWLPESEPVRQATDFVDQNMRGASTVEVVVDSGEVNGLYKPQTMQAIADLGDQVEAIDRGELFVGKTLSLADILKEINKALNENREEFYRVPDDRELIAQEFLLFANSGSDDLEDFVDSQFSQTRFTAKMPWVDAILYPELIDDLNTMFKQELGEGFDINVTGMASLLGRTMSATIHSMAESYVIAALVITVMMILLIGDIRIGLVSMIPNLTPIILTLGIMGFLGLPLDLFTMLIGSIAIGLAVDDTIHFMHNYRRYHHDTGSVTEAVRLTLTTTGRAMLVTTVVLALGFFLFMFANMSNLVNFGLLTGFTIIMALLADFFLAPALMAVLHKSHMIPDDSDY